MTDKLKVRLDPNEAKSVELPLNPIGRVLTLGRLASYLQHDHALPPITRAGLVKRAQEHGDNTGQLGSIIFN